MALGNYVRTWEPHHTPKVTQYFVLSSDTGQRDEDRKGKHLTLTSAAKIKSNSGMTREFVFGLRKVAPATFAHSHTFPRSLAEALADAHLHECQNCSIHSIHLLRSVSLLSIQKSFAPLTMITFTRYPKQSLMKRSGNIEVFVVAFLRRTQDFCTR